MCEIQVRAMLQCENIIGGGVKRRFEISLSN
jgi:hypothetical protein